MPTEDQRLAYWGIVYGGIIAIGATFMAVGLTLGIESIKAQNPSESNAFASMFSLYFISGLIAIILTIYAAARRFLGWEIFDLFKKARDKRRLER
jgi:ABC-type enterochelin transport system permease subunit